MAHSITNFIPIRNTADHFELPRETVLLSFLKAVTYQFEVGVIWENIWPFISFGTQVSHFASHISCRIQIGFVIFRIDNIRSGQYGLMESNMHGGLSPKVLNVQGGLNLSRPMSTFSGNLDGLSDYWSSIDSQARSLSVFIYFALHCGLLPHFMPHFVRDARIDGNSNECDNVQKKYVGFPPLPPTLAFLFGIATFGWGWWTIRFSGTDSSRRVIVGIFSTLIGTIVTIYGIGGLLD